MKLNADIFLFIGLISCISSWISATSVDSEPNYKKMYELEQIKRHVEIRRELEKEATPFLVDGKKKFIDFAAFRQYFANNSNPKKLEGIPTTWSSFFSTFSLVDFAMGTFSVIALGLGSFYMIWRLNPLASKVEK